MVHTPKASHASCQKHGPASPLVGAAPLRQSVIATMFYCIGFRDSRCGYCFHMNACMKDAVIAWVLLHHHQNKFSSQGVKMSLWVAKPDQMPTTQFSLQPPLSPNYQASLSTLPCGRFSQSTFAGHPRKIYRCVARVPRATYMIAKLSTPEGTTSQQPPL